MVKTVTLADDAYEMLPGAKRPGESFSDMIRRLSREEDRRVFLESFGAWQGRDEDV